MPTKPIKTLWVTKKFPPDMGGVQQYVYHYVVNLPRSSCTIITNGSNNIFEVDRYLLNKQNAVYRKMLFPDNLGIYSALKNPKTFYWFCKTIHCFVKKEKVTHVVFGHPSFYFFFAMILLKIILPQYFICIFHGEDIPAIELKSNPLLKWLVKRLDGHMCNSDFTYNRLKRFLQKRIARDIAFPGVEDKFFNCPSTTADCKKKFGLSGKKVLYTVGRLDKRKGHDLVIRALPEIIKHFPDVVYAIGGSGPQMATLKNMVTKFQLDDYVRFYGFVAGSEIVEFHKAGDVFAMPNRTLADGDTEGFGIVFLEANAVGNPVIGGKAGGAVDAVEDGITGFLVDPYTTGEFVEKMLFLLSEPNRAEVIGKNGKQRAWEKFLWPKLANEMSAKLNSDYPAI